MMIGVNVAQQTLFVGSAPIMVGMLPRILSQNVHFRMVKLFNPKTWRSQMLAIVVLNLYPSINTAHNQQPLQLLPFPSLKTLNGEFIIGRVPTPYVVISTERVHLETSILCKFIPTQLVQPCIQI